MRKLRLQTVRRRVGPAAMRVLARYLLLRSELEPTVMTPLREVTRSVARTDREVHERLTELEPILEELVATVRGLSSSERAQAVRLAATLHRLDVMTDRLNVLPYVADDPFTTFASPVGKVIGFTSPPLSNDPLSPYAGFEDIFRGPAERVAESQRPYLQLVADHAPVLDLGCGRGEFLQLLADADIAAEGVDSDSGMVARCREAGLAAVHGDAIDYLTGREDGTVGTIFCAQVIEHLPVAVLQKLLELARRKLRVDGLFIAETVNPHSIPALKTFWVDLTHQHPIFPEVALAFCGLAGFGAAYVFAPGFDDFESARLISNSYAVVARPAAPQP
jgi:SAM-dependent methyltransferase